MSVTPPRESPATAALASQLGSVLRLAGMGAWAVDFERGEVSFDAYLLELLGAEPTEPLRLSRPAWEALVHPDDAARQKEHWQQCLRGERDDYRIDYRLRRRDGQWLCCVFRATVQGRSPQGLARGLVGSYQECPDTQRRQDNLQVAASVFTHAREGISITDPAGKIIDVNEAFTRITGYSREEIIGRNPRILQSGRQSPEFYAAMWKAISTRGHWSGEIWNRRKDGSLFLEVITISAVRNAQGVLQHYVAVFTDVTSERDTERQLESIAHYDVLTGLPNRVRLFDRLRQFMVHCQRRSSSLAVAFLDLDGFKAVNDQHGHAVGDQLLIALSRRMGEALREGDTLARIGGDEFVAVLVDLEGSEDHQPILERLLSAAAKPVALGRQTLQVSASIGVTLYPRDYADAEQLLRHADHAMYQAKQAGKNRMAMFDVAHDAAQASQRQNLADIRAAHEQDQFVLHYQPKVNLRTGEVVGAEALIRWQHPERGLVPPGQFLPVIENHVLSTVIGEWVIASALRQMSHWHAAGLQINVSVNVGARHLLDPGFAQRLQALLAAQTDVAPDCLELEILESSALEDMTQVSELMRRCQALGVRFALDDFGTGFSSLTYMRRLPAEVIKIDQSFVRDILSDADDLAIVQGVIGLAKAFRREVIAEGVETMAHGKVLLSLGCELAQGYGIARPMPAEAFPGWTQAWAAEHPPAPVAAPAPPPPKTDR
ncbi:MAG: EAL domain-containing protein [Burkholderiaceae bacterium]|jgi:diguanylate cyclase (GGDEF)-like protein/PAS domain S-box-containing protein|nr:EAL domain-containing protein [Burkholderiaceae bacterium]